MTEKFVRRVIEKFFKKGNAEMDLASEVYKLVNEHGADAVEYAVCVLRAKQLESVKRDTLNELGSLLCSQIESYVTEHYNTREAAIKNARIITLLDDLRFYFSELFPQDYICNMTGAIDTLLTDARNGDFLPKILSYFWSHDLRVPNDIWDTEHLITSAYENFIATGS
jgi:hypothetical protein